MRNSHTGGLNCTNVFVDNYFKIELNIYLLYFIYK